VGRRRRRVQQLGRGPVSDPDLPGALVGGHCRSPGACPAGTFLAKDGDAQGRYWACFRSYRSPNAGASRFIQVLVRRTTCQGRELEGTMLDAIDSGDPLTVARALYATCYFTTHRTKPDPDERIAEYAEAIEQHLDSLDPCWLSRSLATIKRKPPILPEERPAPVATR
jgi:hypothetical protein